jgi:secreted protein with Ig-like and vWFA domain
MQNWFDRIAQFLGAHWGIASGRVPMRPTFDRPEVLLLAPVLCIGAWWIARRSLAGSPGARSSLQFLIRCLVIVLLTVALAGPHARWRADNVAVVAVLDVSDSVPAGQQKLAADFLNASLANRRDGDRFGLVTIARDPLVQLLPSRTVTRAELGSVGSVDASNLRKGVDLAFSLIPPDAAGRILLISDGNETDGVLAGAAEQLLAAGVPIDVVSVEYDRSAIVRVENLVVPEWARDEDTISARVVLRAGAPSSGRLTLVLNGETVDLDPDSPSLGAHVDLDTGLQVFTLPIKLPSGPVHRMQAVFEPEDSALSLPPVQRAEAVTFTSDRGRVLILADEPEAAAHFTDALARENLTIEVRSGSSAPYTLADWAGFDAVVLFDQPAYAFSQSQQSLLRTYVHDLGGGLLVVGGPRSFGAGGWIGSPLADVLPILLDPPQKRKMPMGALALIIDRSGSMSALVAGANMYQQQIANEAAILGVRALSRLDQITVVAFDGEAETVVPLQSASDPDSIARKIQSIAPGGGTNLFPAIDAAAAQLEKSPAGVKHVIILTDGQTVGDPRDGVARAAELRRRGITLSTVAIGDQSNDPLLVGLARAAGGRFYNVKSQNSKALLPQIFIKEAQTVRRSLIWEGRPFSPKVSALSDQLRGIADPLPGISGYVVTADRGGLSTVAIQGPHGDPILAHWQHGLGRVTAYTSDATTRWNAAWTSWPSFLPFWQQQLKWVMRPTGNANATVAVTPRGERSLVALDLLDPSGDPLNFAAIQAKLVPPASASGPPQDVTFRQTGPGRYEANVETLAVGSHLLSLRYDALGNTSPGSSLLSGSVRAAITHREGGEMRLPTPSTNLLWDLASRSNGRIYRLDRQGDSLWTRDHLTMPQSSRSIWLLVTAAAIAIFLADVASRRIAIDLAKLKSSIASLGAPAPVQTPAGLGVLAAAKARASATQPRAAPEPHPLHSTSPGTAQRPDAAAPPPPQRPVPDKSPNPTPASSTPSSPQAGDTMSRLRAAKQRSLSQDLPSAGEAPNAP